MQALFPPDEAAATVLSARYLIAGADGRESPPALLRRVARAVAEAERRWGGADAAAFWAGRFEDAMAQLLFLPNSPTLMNAGTSLGQLSACFVLPVEDSMEGIFGALRDMALVQRTGGGTGFSFSKLRPRGDAVSTTHGQASGPVSFMRVFDAATENIRQGGKRRGANMAVLRCDHPDVREFIAVKRDGSLRNFNLSIGATDDFMDAAAAGGNLDLRHPRGSAAGKTGAGELLDAAAHEAWHTGDPGMVFLDTIHARNPCPRLGRIEATNPCGEIPLLPNEACTLASLNLARFVRGDPPRLDTEALGATARLVTRFLDDVVEINKYPTAAIAAATRRTRKLGLGVMGYAEMLVRLGIPYGSPAAIDLAHRVMGIIQDAARDESRRLAAERGTHPAWEQSVDGQEGDHVRNATRTAIAPTGTIGILAGTTPGIEPMFALAYRRVGVLDGQTLTEVNPLLAEHLRRLGLDPAPVVEQVRRTGSVEAADVPSEVARLFVTALQLPWQDHLAVQAAFQAHTDNSVSKTINMPTHATPEDVRGAYLSAWRSQCKGVTVFRYGSKPGVLALGADEDPALVEARARCDPGECEL